MANLVKALITSRHFDGFKIVNGKRIRYRYHEGEIVEVSVNALSKADNLKAPDLVTAEAAVAQKLKAAMQVNETNQKTAIETLADASASENPDKEETERLEEAAAEVISAVDEADQEAQENETAEEADAAGEAAEASEAA